MKIKEILNLTRESLKEKMTDEEYNKMQKLGYNIDAFEDALKDSARLSNQKEDEEHVTISDYLDYLKEMQEGDNNE